MTQPHVAPGLTAFNPDTPTRSTACLNCGTTLAGPFCHECGQRDIPPYPSTRELVVDAFWELSGWDGRFASTARALVEKPGMLTREFLEGRRARYLSPLRLYLLASLAYFLIAAATPNLGANVAQMSTVSITTSRPSRVADAAALSMKNGTLTADQKAAVLKDVERAPTLMRPFLQKAIADPNGLRRGILETMPRMLFALLPVFAAIVALFYRGRKYPEHLYFAIHLHSFFFVVMAAADLTKFTHVLKIAQVAGFLTLLAIPIYSTMAFRRVYGGGVARTLLKEIGIAAIYGVLSLAGFVLLLYWVSIMG